VAGRLRLRVVTPRREVLDREVDEVRLPGVLGEMGVLPGHTPLLTSLAIGPLTLFHGGTTERLVIAGGFAEVLPDAVTVLPRLAERSDDIDAEAARVQVAESTAALATATAEELDEITAALRLAESRLAVAGR
jgi:F-type H+-transporting ATPase subunit epsilon